MSGMQGLRSVGRLLWSNGGRQCVRTAAGDATVIPMKSGDIYVDMPLIPVAFTKRWLLSLQIGLFCAIPFAIPFYGLRRALMKKF